MNEMIDELREENAKLREEVEILKNKRLSLIDALSGEASTCMTWKQRAEETEAERDEANKVLASMFWYFDASGNKFPEASEAARKRDIEQRLEALEAYRRNLIEMGLIGGVSEHLVTEKIDQLRKELNK